MSRAFEWIELGRGAGRFCGLTRGWDEALHETFAVLVDGRPFYGEVRKMYAGHDASIEVVSFGYPDELDIALPDVRHAFSGQQAEAVESTIRELIAVVADYPNRRDKPASLRSSPSTYFSGNVSFANDWITIAAAGSTVSQ